MKIIFEVSGPELSSIKDTGAIQNYLFKHIPSLSDRFQFKEVKQKLNFDIYQIIFVKKGGQDESS